MIAIPKWTAFAAIVLAAFVIRIAFVIAVPTVPVSDFAWYYERAIQLASGLGYAVHGHPTAFWPPGWPYLLAGVVKIAGPSVLAGQIVQALLNALTAGMVFLIGRAVFGMASAVAAAAAYTLLPSAVEWSATLASEPLYTLLWATSTYIWVSRAPSRLGWFAVSGLLLGAAALVRPSALLFWVVLLIYAVAVRTERKQWRSWAAAVAVSAVCTVLVVTPYVVRNYHVFGTLVIVSNNGGVSLYQANNPKAGGGYTELSDARIQRLIDDPRTEVAADRLASKLAIQYIKTHPANELRLILWRMKALYSRDDSVIRFTLRSRHFREPQSPPPSDRVASTLAAVNNGVYYTVMLFALFGIALCCLKRPAVARSPRWGLLLGLILYNTAVFAMIFGLDRYRYPTMPYFCVFAGFALASLASYYLVRSRSNAVEINRHFLPADRGTLVHD